ncbi:MAG: hypothetical protein NVS9B10_06770 [Nevskia sp.]
MTMQTSLGAAFAPRVSSRSTEAAGTRILLIDDEIDQHRVVASLLRGGLLASCQLVCATSLAEAHRHLRETPFDICLVDYRLGPENGLDLLSFAWSELASEPACIILTARGNPAIDDEALRLGAADYRVKEGLDADTLHRSLRYALRQRRTLNEVRDSERRYRALFESVPVPVWLRDRDSGRILDANEAATRLYGYPREVFVTLNARQLLDDTDRPGEETRFPAARHRAADGRCIEVALQRRDLDALDGRQELIVANDVTEQRAGERLLRSDKARLERMVRVHETEAQRTTALHATLLDYAPLMIACFNPQGREPYFNRSWYRQVPETAPHWMTGDSWLDAVHAEDRERVTVSWNACLARLEPMNLECRLGSGPGAVLHVLCIAAPVRADAGAVIGWILMMTDISEHKKIEADLQLSNHALETFSHAASHDLSGPLHVVSSFTEMLSDSCAEQLSSEGQRALLRIRAGTQRMSDILDGLLALTRVTVADCRQVPVDLAVAARRVLDDLQFRDPQRALVRMLPESLVTDGDPQLIQVLLENLLGNAWKFTCCRPLTTISIACETLDTGETCFVIQDNGVGFDMRFSDKLFSPFERLHRYDDYPGTGIGLATVKRIIDRHGGRIWIDSELDAGTRVCFTLQRRAALETV